MKRTAVDTESGVRHAIVKDGYDGETGLNIAAVPRESDIGKLDNHSLTITIC